MPRNPFWADELQGAPIPPLLLYRASPVGMCTAAEEFSRGVHAVFGIPGAFVPEVESRYAEKYAELLAQSESEKENCHKSSEGSSTSDDVPSFSLVAVDSFPVVRLWDAALARQRREEGQTHGGKGGRRESRQGDGLPNGPARGVGASGLKKGEAGGGEVLKQREMQGKDKGERGKQKQKMNRIYADPNALLARWIGAAVDMEGTHLGGVRCRPFFILVKDGRVEELEIGTDTLGCVALPRDASVELFAQVATAREEAREAEKEGGLRRGTRTRRTVDRLADQLTAPLVMGENGRAGGGMYGGEGGQRERARQKDKAKLAVSDGRAKEKEAGGRVRTKQERPREESELVIVSSGSGSPSGSASDLPLSERSDDEGPFAEGGEGRGQREKRRRAEGEKQGEPEGRRLRSSREKEKDKRTSPSDSAAPPGLNSSLGLLTVATAGGGEGDDLIMGSSPSLSHASSVSPTGSLVYGSAGGKVSLPKGSGVSFHKSSLCWRARYRHKGRVVQKDFSVQRHGEKALQMALEWRREHAPQSSPSMSISMGGMDSPQQTMVDVEGGDGKHPVSALHLSLCSAAAAENGGEKEGKAEIVPGTQGERERGGGTAWPLFPLHVSPPPLPLEGSSSSCASDGRGVREGDEETRLQPQTETETGAGVSSSHQSGSLQEGRGGEGKEGGTLLEAQEKIQVSSDGTSGLLGAGGTEWTSMGGGGGGQG
eukprot:Cvel_24402.t1-p1 / transcript=Cvel_24402.t1 / gene=Cvel_24402 / organism=Chromera_velia_CCMP2878 / gene_product=hypothetical protein / transcript_product=hypothetical protein / location=Cvel_scaffold2633:1-3946(-) / protein_length=712 / sequence_SO=supercontig / SO=protein_coding / is_pseudo=false